MIRRITSEHESRRASKEIVRLITTSVSLTFTLKIRDEGDKRNDIFHREMNKSTYLRPEVKR